MPSLMYVYIKVSGATDHINYSEPRKASREKGPRCSSKVKVPSLHTFDYHKARNPTIETVGASIITSLFKLSLLYCQ